MNVNERIHEMFEHRNPDNHIYKAQPGLNEEVIRKISQSKNEPEWMLNFRLKSFEVYKNLKIPDWGADLSKLNTDKIIYYAVSDAKQNAKSWDEVPEDIKNTFKRLGIPEAEQKYLAGVGAQYDSTNVYHKLKDELEKQGIIFEDMDVALQKYPDLIKEYFMTKCISISLHKYVALHGAVWSSGTFIYIPENVKLEKPLQAYFRMNTGSFGQFEHTLIILEKNSEAHYIEGCSSAKYESPSLHAGCVELFVKEGAKLRYSSVENWSKDTYNLNTKRAIVEKNGTIEWVTGNTGSKCSMVYPCSVLKGENSRADHLSVGYAGRNQIQDIGAKVYHVARNTTSIIKSKSISKNGGIARYRGLLNVSRSAINAKSKVQCDALMLDNISKSDTIPVIEIKQNKASIAHEATVGKISQDQIFYLMSRGLTEEQATQMIVNGFIEPIIKELPIEYAVELNRLIELEIEGSLG
jgi:Fe-S cluster assembly protein SufB